MFFHLRGASPDSRGPSATRPALDDALAMRPTAAAHRDPLHQRQQQQQPATGLGAAAVAAGASPWSGGATGRSVSFLEPSPSPSSASSSSSSTRPAAPRREARVVAAAAPSHSSSSPSAAAAVALHRRPEYRSQQQQQQQQLSVVSRRRRRPPPAAQPTLVSSHSFAATPCGLFVTQSAVVEAVATSALAAAAAAYGAAGSSAPVRPGLVVSVECGGWLRVRDLVPSGAALGAGGGPTTTMSAATEAEGQVRYQCRLSQGHEASAACGVVARPPRDGASPACLLVVGLLTGGLATFAVAGESLMERQTVPWAAAPVTQVVSLSSDGGQATLVLSASADAAVAVWTAAEDGLSWAAESATVGYSPLVVAAAPPPPPNDGGDGGALLLMNRVPVGYEEELSRGDAAVFLVACPPPAVEDGEWAVVQVFSAPGGAVGGGVVSLCCVAAEGGGSGPQLWAGTSAGELFVWALDSGDMLRRIALPTPSPVHALAAVAPYTAPPAPAEGSPAFPFYTVPLPAAVWASQLNGDVTAWEGRAFSLLQQLTLSYPPPPRPTRSGSSKGAPRGRRSDGAGTAAAAVVADGVALTRTLRGDAALAPQHFTTAVRPLEPVLMWRTWSAATDGTVRCWLTPGSTTAAAANGHGMATTTTATTTAAAGPALDAAAVRAFLHARAEETAVERAAHAAAVAELQQRNQQLTEALREATAQLQRYAAAASRPDAGESGSGASGSGDGGGEGLVETPVHYSGGPAAPAEPSRAENLAQLLASLRGRLDNTMDEREAYQRELAAHRLRALDDAAAAYDALEGRGRSPTPSSSSSSSSASVSCSSEDVALVEAWSSVPIRVNGAPFHPPAASRPYTSSNGSSPSAYWGGGSTILAPQQHLPSPY